MLRQRLAALHIEHELLRLIRLRTVTARIKGEPPGAEASIRKILADEHGQAIMGLAKDLAGASGMLTGNGPGEVPGGMWHYGFLFAPRSPSAAAPARCSATSSPSASSACPHDVDVEQGQTWSESRRAG